MAGSSAHAAAMCSPNGSGASNGEVCGNAVGVMAGIGQEYPQDDADSLPQALMCSPFEVMALVVVAQRPFATKPR